MAITAITSSNQNAHSLADAIRDYLRGNTSSTWECDGNDLKQRRGQETHSGHFVMSPEVKGLTFYLKHSSKITEEAFSQLHGRLTSFLLQHFRDQFMRLETPSQLQPPETPMMNRSEAIQAAVRSLRPRT